MLGRCSTQENAFALLRNRDLEPVSSKLEKALRLDVRRGGKRERTGEVARNRDPEKWAQFERLGSEDRRSIWVINNGNELACRDAGRDFGFLSNACGEANGEWI